MLFFFTKKVQGKGQQCGKVKRLITNLVLIQIIFFIYIAQLMWFDEDPYQQR